MPTDRQTDGQIDRQTDRQTDNVDFIGTSVGRGSNKNQSEIESQKKIVDKQFQINT